MGVFWNWHTKIFAMVCSPVSYMQCQVCHGECLNSFNCALHLTALAIYTRSPAAFRAVRSIGILQLPCCKELQRIVSCNADGPGIHEQYIANQSEAYQTFCESKVASERKKPLGIGVLIFDETKVSGMLFSNKHTLMNPKRCISVLKR